MFLLIVSKIVFLIVLVLPYFVGKYTTFLERKNACGEIGNVLLVYAWAALLCFICFLACIVGSLLYIAILKPAFIYLFLTWS